MLPWTKQQAGIVSAPLAEPRAWHELLPAWLLQLLRDCLHLAGITVRDDAPLVDGMNRRRPGKRLTSPERWEVTQLIKSGVLDVSEYPTFDDEGQVGLRPARQSTVAATHQRQHAI